MNERCTCTTCEISELCSSAVTNILATDPECPVHSDPPPTPRYRYTIVIDSNTLDEVFDELTSIRSAIWLDSREPGSSNQRDEWDILAGTGSRRMEHRNPDMTPDRYATELRAWSVRRRTRRQRKEDE